MRKILFFVTTLFVILVSVPPSSGHASLINPPSRSSAWRDKYTTPTNYNDQDTYCGGFSRQWQRNGGKCGVCGDPWDEPQPRANELGGKYGLGVIVAVYRHASVIEIGVQLTASHGGYFEFNICPYNNKEPVTESYLDKYLLRRADGRGFRFYPEVYRYSRTYNMQYNLPWGVTCRHCVLRWRYVAANNWGKCANGTEKWGCGPQEEFRSCADIRIIQNDKDSTTEQSHNETTIRTATIVTTQQSHNVTTIKTTTKKPNNCTETDECDNNGDFFTALYITLTVVCVIIVLLIIIQKVLMKRGKQVSTVNQVSEDIMFMTDPELASPIQGNGSSPIRTISVPSTPIRFIPTD